MRLVFFGSPDFAVPSLEALVAAGHEVALVVSQPARPVGRHGEPSDPAVARLAKSLSLPLFQPESLKADDAVARLAGPRADLFVVAAYGKILAQRVLDLPRLFCLNAHGSVLPRWRGASPVQAAILAGDATTGVSIMKMEAGMDTGPVLAVRETPIRGADTAATLGARLSAMGASLLVETIGRLPVPLVPQDDARATYCPKIAREDGLVDWSRPALELARRDRAFTPWPGLFTFRKASRLKLAGLEPAPRGAADAAPGTVLATSPALVIACGEGAVSVAALQAEGRRRLAAADFVRGERVAPGEIWPS
jgi:methionyl-tRNA formyltransferase